jgi:hypothetical protein
MIGAGLAFAAGSQAKTRHNALKCGRGYVRRSIRVPERKHGRIVRRHGKIVYTRVQRCVRIVKPTSTSFPQGTGSTTLSPPYAPANTALPTISGSAAEGSTLSASAGTWTNTPTGYAYQWQRCDSSGNSCQSVPGSTTPTYLVGTADNGSTLQVSVTASNASGSASATSAAVGPVTSPTDPVVVAVGDIACPATGGPSCRQAATEAIARSQNPSAVFVLGDNQYDSGLYSEYTGLGAYGATWGVFNPIVHPVPGNHEYLASSAAAGYFQYFGVVAHPPEGYYSFNLGTWHIVALNSNCSDTSGCSDALAGGTTSAQTSWLQSDLAANRSPCVLAMWHHPLFSSGWTLGTPGVAPLWTALYSAHADVVLSGHDHLYERYAQEDPTGNATTSGIREFVVGTGGESLNGLSAHPSTLQASDASDFGVLVLTLHAGSYSWKFVNISGTTVDSGTTACHGSGTASIAAVRHITAAQLARLSGPRFSFDARPIAESLATVRRQGLPVAVHCSRGCDVTVTAALIHGRQLRRVASFYETESDITGPYSQIVLRLPARALNGLNAATLVLRFSALDAARHHRVVTRSVSLK